MSYPEAFNPAWHLRESAFEPDHLRYYESVFALGNGYLGTRGSMEERLPQADPATLIAGLFDKAPDEVTELANVANWVGIELWIDGRPVGLGQNPVIAHERILDLETGILHRKSLLQCGPARQISIVSRRFVSVADVHLMGIQYTFALKDRRPGKCALLVRSGFDGNVTNAGIQHFTVSDHGLLLDNCFFVHEKALYSNHQVALGGRLQLFKAEEPVTTRQSVQREGNHVWMDARAEIETDTLYTLEKTVIIYSSRESEEPLSDVSGKLEVRRAASLHVSLDEHKKTWAQRWANADIEIEGDEAAQLALRFSIFHLLQAASETDDRVSVAAKALTGLGYKGHVFWDTETFILPYLNITNPLLSRNMLTYRYHTLEEARKKAQRKGYRGALFAWESADTGEETTPPHVMHATRKTLITIWSGVSEHHVDADVAHAVWQYYMTTGDTEFLLRYGAEILLDTARFWSSRAYYNEPQDRFEIATIIGPDEYHENIDNNYFTNAMARWNIRKGVDVYDWLKTEHPTDWRRISERLNLQEEEITAWEEVAGKLFIHVDPEKHVFVQFDGFMDLEDVDLERYADRTQPMDVVLGTDAIRKSKINKQPDVLMIFSLLRDDFSKEEKVANWRFYEPRCGHGSSLSPAIHSLIASDIGLADKAYEYFVRAAGIDMNDKMGNTGHGIHAATAGGLLQAAIYGFAGLKITDEGIVLNPRLPEQWRSMKFNVWYRGKRIHVSINRESPAA